MHADRIISNAPQTIHEVLQLLETEIKQFSMVRTAVIRYVVPAWGGPAPQHGKHVTLEAIEFLRTVPIDKLVTALRDQKYYFEQIGLDKSARRRNSHYLRNLVKHVVGKGWLPSISRENRTPEFNRFTKPRGERRLGAADVRTTTRKRPKEYSLGTHSDDFVLNDGQEILANATLNRELREIESFGLKFRKPKQVQHQIGHLRAIFGYLRRETDIALQNLSLEILIPFVQLRFSEEDFTQTGIFAKNERKQLLDPVKAEQTLAMAESIAQRTAKARSKITIEHIENFFDFRKRELSDCGQPDGLAPTSRRAVIDGVILAAKWLYRDQTDVEETDNFEDISVIRRLRLLLNQQQLDQRKTQKQIQKRCVSWERAMRVFDKQRLLSQEVHLASRDRSRKSGKVIRQRKVTAVAKEVQKTVVAGLMLFIPTDRQQTYRGLKFGETLKNGYFEDEHCEQFIDQGIPKKSNDAQLWINLVDFKTVDTYGEFWYPIPNIQFADNTTFYQYIAAWLWGFEDIEGVWPEYHEGENSRWQGFIDDQGQRMGWRAALAPKHDYVFTMPSAGTQFYDNTFTSLIKNIFIRHTQEDGAVVPVTPHSFRHMLSTYLDRLGISGKEEQSFAYVLHHSAEMHQGHYVYRDNMTRISPAVKRMEQIIRTFL